MGILVGLLVVVGVLLVAVVVFFAIGERGRLKPSTLAQLRGRPAGPRPPRPEGSAPRRPRPSRWAFFRDSLHMYVYARWTTEYIGWLRKHVRRAGEQTRTWWRDRYHGKVLTHDHARAFFELDRSIDRRDLEQIIPFPIARDLVLKAPLEVAAYECACRNSRKEHCSPTQVCMVIGKAGADFIVEHHPNGSRRLTQAEALQLLEDEYQRGHLHSAWFKDAAAGRMYAICNCCKCCCAGIEMMTELGTKVMVSSGFVARLDHDLCTDCGVCATACPFGAITANGSTEVSWDKCMGCGVCVSQCKTDAVALERDPKKGEPLDVRAL